MTEREQAFSTKRIRSSEDFLPESRFTYNGKEDHHLSFILDSYQGGDGKHREDVFVGTWLSTDESDYIRIPKPKFVRMVETLIDGEDQVGYRSRGGGELEFKRGNCGELLFRFSGDLCRIGFSKIDNVTLVEVKEKRHKTQKDKLQDFLFEAEEGLVNNISKLLGGFWSQEIEECLKNTESEDEYTRKNIAEALGLTALATKDQETINAVAKAMNSYRTFPIIKVPNVFIILCNKNIKREGASDVIKHVAKILDETGSWRFSNDTVSEIWGKLDPSDQRPYIPIEKIREFFPGCPNPTEVGVYIADVLRVISERIDEQQAIMSTATCLRNYARSNKFHSICELFRILGGRGWPDVGTEPWRNYAQTVEVVAEKFASEEMVRQLNQDDETEFKEWVHDCRNSWFLIEEENDVRIYFLNPPSKRLANRLKDDPERARAIEEACQIMAFDPDEEKRVQAERRLRNDLIKNYFDLKVVNKRAFIAIRHFFPPSPGEYVYVCSASQNKGWRGKCRQ